MIHHSLFPQWKIWQRPQSCWPGITEKLTSTCTDRDGSFAFLQCAETNFNYSSRRCIALQTVGSNRRKLPAQSHEHLVGDHYSWVLSNWLLPNQRATWSMWIDIVLSFSCVSSNFQLNIMCDHTGHTEWSSLPLLNCGNTPVGSSCQEPTWHRPKFTWK